VIFSGVVGWCSDPSRWLALLLDPIHATSSCVLSATRSIQIESVEGVRKSAADESLRHGTQPTYVDTDPPLSSSSIGIEQQEARYIIIGLFLITWFYLATYCLFPSVI